MESPISWWKKKNNYLSPGQSWSSHETLRPGCWAWIKLAFSSPVLTWPVRNPGIYIKDYKNHLTRSVGDHCPHFYAWKKKIFPRNAPICPAKTWPVPVPRCSKPSLRRPSWPGPQAKLHHVRKRVGVTRRKFTPRDATTWESPCGTTTAAPEWLHP